MFLLYQNARNEWNCGCVSSRLQSEDLHTKNLVQSLNLWHRKHRKTRNYRVKNFDGRPKRRSKNVCDGKPKWSFWRMFIHLNFILFHFVQFAGLKASCSTPIAETFTSSVRVLIRHESHFTETRIIQSPASKETTEEEKTVKSSGSEKLRWNDRKEKKQLVSSFLLKPAQRMWKVSSSWSPALCSSNLFCALVKLENEQVVKNIQIIVTANANSKKYWLSKYKESQKFLSKITNLHECVYWTASWYLNT